MGFLRELERRGFTVVWTAGLARKFGQRAPCAMFALRARGCPRRKPWRAGPLPLRVPSSNLKSQTVTSTRNASLGIKNAPDSHTRKRLKSPEGTRMALKQIVYAPERRPKCFKTKHVRTRKAPEMPRLFNCTTPTGAHLATEGGIFDARVAGSSFCTNSDFARFKH